MDTYNHLDRGQRRQCSRSTRTVLVPSTAAGQHRGQPSAPAAVHQVDTCNHLERTGGTDGRLAFAEGEGEGYGRDDDGDDGHEWHSTQAQGGGSGCTGGDGGDGHYDSHPAADSDGDDDGNHNGDRRFARLQTPTPNATNGKPT